MSRTRRPLARGTRLSSGILSAVSWATEPSGVTIDQYGIVTDSATIAQSELDYLDSVADSIISHDSVNQLLVSGVSNWAGSTVSLATKLTTIDQLVGTIINTGAGTMELSLILGKPDSVAGYVSAAIRYDPAAVGEGSAIADVATAPGCSIAFIALGS